jgi:RsiW-degrading membrane proteinase PrsW (M82 family)
MAIKVTCACGKSWLAADEFIGRSVPCAACGRTVEIAAPREDDLALQPLDPFPASPASAHPAPTAPPLRRAASATPAWSIKSEGADDPAPLLVPERTWRYRYLLFSLALLPLFFSLFHAEKPGENDLEERFESSLVRQLGKASTDAQEAAKTRIEELSRKAGRGEEVTLSESLAVLPEGKLDGALLRRDSWGHWFLAALSAAGYFTVLLLLFPRGKANSWQLLKVGLFTGTLGIFLLLAFQWISMLTQAVNLHGGSIIVLIFYIVKFIGYSYRAALDPSNGFWLSCMGFTFGVGLCEELCKGLPMLWHYRRPLWALDWRGACLWGLASGIGFGVSEGITYSSDYYNGMLSGDIYWIRFVSCVALHAIWAAAVGFTSWRRQDDLKGNLAWYEFLFAAVRIVAVPMVLHGLYDTLLKRDMEVWAFVSALASFGWLALEMERARRATEEMALQGAPA